ncbi:hypothetical protein B0J14DRAFT_296301 [Halenospora varia]|nr:hypothetical protein B0J14DRAFT_296301 [Halenospora varia]
MTTTRPAEVNNGVTTSWIALTTPGFSAAPECSSQMYRVPGSSNINAFDPVYGKIIPNAVSCLPVEVSQVALQTSSGSTKLSLGPFNCPSMFSTAATATVNSKTTIVACCPSQYTYREDTKCISTVSIGQQVVIQSLSGAVAARAEATSNGDIIVTGVGITGYNFKAEATESQSISTTITANIIFPEATTTASTSWQAVSTPSPTSSINTAGGQTKITTPSSSPSPIPTSSGGLSVGAKVGITMSVVFAVIAALVLIAGLHIKRRRNRQRRRRQRLEAPREPDTIQIRRKPKIIETSPQPGPSETKRETQEHPMADFASALSPDFLGPFETPGHPGKRIPIDSIIIDPGPHEMEVPETHELPAGTVEGPTEKELEAAIDREREMRHYGRETPTPTPTLELKRVQFSERPQYERDISETRGGRVSRDTSETRRAGRDARLDIPGGCISPMSTSERSFLDLSDMDD